MTSTKCIWTISAIALLWWHPAAAQDTTFRYAARSDVSAMDPHGLLDGFAVGFLQQIYEPLVRFNEEMQIAPALATSWQRIDADTMRFSLREGVSFHDGQPFTSEDVVFSFQRAKAPTSDLLAVLATVQDIRAIDAQTVDVITDGPDPTLLNALTAFSIMSRAWSEVHATLEPTHVGQAEENYAAAHANGTGPYALASRRQDVQTRLERNADWWGMADHPQMPAVLEFTPVADDVAMMAGLSSDKLQLAYPLPLNLVGQLQADPKIDVIQAVDLRTMFLGFDFTSVRLRGGDQQDNPFSHRLVREAVDLAIDRQVLHRVTMRGFSRPTTSILSPVVEGYDVAFDDVAPADPARAKVMLAEAGYPAGFSTDFNCSRGRFANDDQICGAIVTMLAEVGITANALIQPPRTFYQQIFSYNSDFYLLGVAPPTADAITILRDFAHTRTDDLGVYNVGGYANSDLDQLTLKVAQTSDPETRRGLISEALAILDADTVFVPLHQQMVVWGIDKRFSVTPRPDNTLMPWLIVPSTQ